MGVVYRYMGQQFKIQNRISFYFVKSLDTSTLGDPLHVTWCSDHGNRPMRLSAGALWHWCCCCSKIPPQAQQQLIKCMPSSSWAVSIQHPPIYIVATVAVFVFFFAMVILHILACICFHPTSNLASHQKCTQTKGRILCVLFTNPAYIQALTAVSHNQQSRQFTHCSSQIINNSLGFLDCIS